MTFTALSWEIFNQSIRDYHLHDDVHTVLENPYRTTDITHLLYKKNWIDTVQWHLEDLIRDPEIDPVKALELKRWIDASNQERTDTVEFIDAWFLQQYQDVKPLPEATINTESPAWGIDRLSILALKIYHMKEEVERVNIDAHYRETCQQKLTILESQHQDLSSAIEQLLQDIQTGKKYMKTYMQMKMYNDEDMNPVLRKKKA